jgi:hypothetical protein
MKLVTFYKGKSQTISILTDTTLYGFLGENLENYVVFTGEPSDTNATPLVKYELTLADYNLWLNKNESVSISIYEKDNTKSYNYERYQMYLKLYIL